MQQHHTEEVSRLQQLIRDQQEALTRHKKQLDELIRLVTDSDKRSAE